MLDSIRGWTREVTASGPRVTAGLGAVGSRPSAIEWALHDGDLPRAKFLASLLEVRRLTGLPSTTDAQRQALWTVLRRDPGFDPRWLSPAEAGIVTALWERSRPPSGLAGALARSGAARFLASLPPATLSALAVLPVGGPALYALAASASSSAAAIVAQVPALSGYVGTLDTYEGAELRQASLGGYGVLETPIPAGKLGSIAVDPSRSNLEAVAVAQATEVAAALAPLASSAAGLAAGSAGDLAARGGLQVVISEGLSVARARLEGQAIAVRDLGFRLATAVGAILANVGGVELGAPRELVSRAVAGARVVITRATQESAP